MGLAGPNGPTEKRRAELIGGLYLVGARGKYCGVVTEQQLTIERFDGKGFRLDLGAIERMRHLKIPVLPPGTNLIGLIAIYLGITTIVSPISWLAIAAGSSIIVSNIVSRYAILAIETGSGDRHLISGSEGNLLKLCLIVDRLRHGCKLEEAMLGLENLETEIPAFPTIRDFSETIGDERLASLPLTTESGGIVPEQEERMPLIGTIGEEENKFPFPSEEKSDLASIPNGGNIESSIGNNYSEQNAYERAWGVQEAPTWYKEKKAEPKDGSRIDSAFSDAAEGLDMFSPGGLFDSTPTPDSPQSNDNEMGLFDFDFESPKEEAIERSFSSSQMIKKAHQEFGAPESPFHRTLLPPPTEEAVREECKAGIVKQARAMQELKTKRNVGLVNVQTANLDDYPALKGLANTMSGNRAVGINRKRGVSGGWLSRLLSPSSTLDREKYDTRGTSNEIETERFQTTQHMRLRSDQEHQAEISSRIRSLRTYSTSTTAKNKLDSIVGGLSGLEDGRHALGNRREPLKFNQLKPTSSEDDPNPLPGLRRLG